jgi:hypothetical protein
MGNFAQTETTSARKAKQPIHNRRGIFARRGHASSGMAKRGRERERERENKLLEEGRCPPVADHSRWGASLADADAFMLNPV